MYSEPVVRDVAGRPGPVLDAWGIAGDHTPLRLSARASTQRSAGAGREEDPDRFRSVGFGASLTPVLSWPVRRRGTIVPFGSRRTAGVGSVATLPR